MTRVTFLSKNPGLSGQYTVRFDNGTSMRLYRQTIEDFGLCPGREFSETELSDLTEAAGKISARMRAVRIVSSTSVSKKDLEQRLVRKGEDPQQAREAVSWMSDLNLLDDRKTAEQIVYRCISKGYGIKRAKQVLFEKRIPREIWDEVLENYPDQMDQIEDFLRTRLQNNPTDRETKKAIDALLRRGHSWSTIRQALRQYVQDADDYMEE